MSGAAGLRIALSELKRQAFNFSSAVYCIILVHSLHMGRFCQASRLPSCVTKKDYAIRHELKTKLEGVVQPPPPAGGAPLWGHVIPAAACDPYLMLDNANSYL